MADEKRSSPLTTKKHEESIKLRTEIKRKIDDMLSSGVKITKADISRKCEVSRSFLNSPEMDKYIKAAQKIQEEQGISEKKEETSIYRKLMASYIFQYALMDEQEALLLEVIKDLKRANGLEDDSSHSSD